jgi:hydrogenase maturation protease
VHLEDADLISTCRRVLFVDAARALGAPFALTVPEPAFEVPFTAHALTVPTVLATCRRVFGRLPETHLLALRGTDFELAEGLTDGARAALAAALAALT